jgi:hypothetical protein
MTQAPIDPATAPAGTTGPGGEAHERDWAALELEVLHDLARIGNSISEQLNQGYQATAAALPAGSPARVKADREVALAFMRLSRAVRLTMAMFGRVRLAREALAAGVFLPGMPAMPGRPRPSAEAAQRAAAAMARTLARDLDAELDDEDLDDEEDLFDDLYDGPDPADAPDRPDRESLTEFADFGFSLDRCGPGEVIARIYHDLGLPPDPIRWPQAWPDGVPAPASVPAKATGRAGTAGRDIAPGLDRAPNRPEAPAHSSGPHRAGPHRADPEPPPTPPPEAGQAPSADPSRPSARQHGPPEDSS